MTVTGEQKITAVSIQEDVFESGDREMLEDLVLAAANEAIGTSPRTASEERCLRSLVAFQCRGCFRSWFKTFPHLKN